MTAAKQTKRPSFDVSKLPKLNLGAGELWLPGYVNVDIDGGGEPVDLSIFPWPYNDNSIGTIVASHILEHFTKYNALRFLNECYRILAPGGWLFVAVPDMDIFINCKLADDWTAVYGYKWTDFNWFLGGDMSEPRPEMRHYYMYNYETLRGMMYDVGFHHAYRREFSPDIDNPRHRAISLYMTGVK